MRAAIFDMDGLIINSEPLWQEAEIHVFDRHGISLTIDECLGTQGMRVDEVVNYWTGKKGQGLNCVPEKIVSDLLDEVERLIRKKGQLMPGVEETILFLNDRGIKLAIASSSWYRTIQAVLDVTGIQKHFPVIHSAEDEKNGKPHPAVFLSTLKKLNVSAEESIAFEDSLNGMRSARAAGIYTIVVPEKGREKVNGFEEADLLIHSLEDFQSEAWPLIEKRFTETFP